MKVIVAKMPGGKAVSVNVEEGATIMDAISAAGYSNGLEGGFELRKNDAPANASDPVAHSDIISLTAKITGNMDGIIHLAFLKDDGSYACQDFLRTFPMKAKDLFAPENDAERIQVEAFILTHSGKDEFDASDYVFAAIKKDQASDAKFKNLVCCNFVAADSLVVVENKPSDGSVPAIDGDSAIKLYETMLAVPETISVTLELSEDPKPKKKRKKTAKSDVSAVPAETDECAEVQQEKPKKKRRKTACKCENKCDEVTEEAAMCECAKLKEITVSDTCEPNNCYITASRARSILMSDVKTAHTSVSMTRSNITIKDAIDFLLELETILGREQKIFIGVDLSNEK